MIEKRIHDPETELADRDTIEKLQWHKLKKILAHVWETNAFYRRKWEASGVALDRINSFEDFSNAIPMVEKKDFIADQRDYPPYGSRLAHPLSLKGRLDLYTTSGTSGQGIEIHAQTARELVAMEEVYRYYFKWAGMNAGDRTLLTLPVTMLAGGRIELEGAVGYGLSVMPAGNYKAQEKLDAIRRFRPKALYGSTSYFGHLAAICDDSRNLEVEVLLTGLEGAGFSYLQRLEDQWGAKVADRFGCSNLRCDFIFTTERGIGEPGDIGIMLNIDPFVYLEVLDTTTGLPVADGEFGELVVTSLYHFDNPVVRNRLRDGAVYRKPSSRRGERPFKGIELASITRTDDVKKVKGINLYPQAVDDVIFSLSEVDEYEVHLMSAPDMSDIAAVRIMTKGPLPEADRASFVNNISGLLRQRMGISFAIDLVDHLPRSEFKARRWRDERER